MNAIALPSEAQRSPCLHDTWRLLTFRLKPAEFDAFTADHLRLGLLLCWLAGIGRFWAAPHLPWYQHLGLGSVLYPFLLAIPVAILTRPFARWAAIPYLHIVTFIALTGPIALLYAPISPDWLGVEGASVTRALALATVSTWRVALLLYFCMRLAGLSLWETLAAVALLLTGIVVSLTALNLEQVVFNLMGGRSARTVSDDSFGLLLGLSALSILALPISFLTYLFLWTRGKSAISQGAGEAAGG